MHFIPELVQIIIAFSTGAIIGFFAGWYTKTRLMSNSKDYLRPMIAIVVMFVWAVSAMLDIALTDYATPWAIHALFGGIIGAFFELDVSKFFNNKR